uniref:Transposase (Putative), gypsy type n=1 Tax=Tanacetum cinerariifolium TaxID=118510 RepID=A0A6L2LHU9_TANCI|nr:hypothetical protein [Tanacetum cinerariifolium]
MPTKIEPTLEQSQQSVSNNVLVSIEGVEELKGNVWINSEKESSPPNTLGRNQESQIKMIQVKEMMQDKDLKNSKSKDEGSRSRSQSMNDQSHYKQAKTKTNDETRQPPTRIDAFVCFFCHSDLTKVRIGERNLADREVKLLKMTKGRTILLNPPITAPSGDSGDSIDKMFDEGNDANQEHLVGKDDDVLEEVVALDASKLRDDHQSLPPLAGGKSLFALRGMVSEGSAIPSDATKPLATAFVTPMSDVGPVDFVSELNLRTRPPHVRSDADVPVVMVSVTTTIDVNVSTGSKAKDAPKYFEHIGDSASAGRVDADAANISKLKKPYISSDSFYASQSLNTKIMHRLLTMDYDQLYSEFNVGAARQVCVGAEVRMRVEHTLERKNKLEDRSEAAEAISLRSQLSMVEAADAAKVLEYVATSKEVKLASLSSQVVNLTADLSGFQLSRDEFNSKVTSLESERDCLATQKNSLESTFELFKEQVEKMQDEQVGVLSDRVAAVDSDLMEMVLHMDAEFYPRCLTTIVGRRWILSRRLRLVLAKCFSSPEYISAMGEAIGRAIDKGMQDGLATGIEHGIARRSIMDVVMFNPFAESDYIVAINSLQGVSFSLLDQLEANKDASMTDIMDLLRLKGLAAETSEASQLQPSLDQLMISIH